MKYQFVFVVSTGLLICGCKSEDAGNEEIQAWITTEEKLQERSSEHEEKIQGTWNVVSSTCPSEDVNSAEKWSFDKGELTWNSYTHPYHFDGDTLIIAGRAHSVSWKGNVLVLGVLEMNCKKELKRL
ncbi:MAG: hypothetical protein A3D92_00285 [Bacteroidetes bacterium RIFCSPHIGHO2_02_FULL_44_7]|nr:MAG: hypothetical protein A3D92_00285 [Bacteroidetes bacterium RIFCSPHIGHO2_02_FULL_44_7]